jgi:single-strand DNA-binding protein
LKKGRLVAVAGRLQVRSYDDNQGIRRKASEVIADQIRFLDYGKNGDNNPSSSEEELSPETEYSEENVPF